MQTWKKIRYIIAKAGAAATRRQKPANAFEGAFPPMKSSVTSDRSFAETPCSTKMKDLPA
jgi:hypothetical protein